MNASLEQLQSAIARVKTRRNIGRDEILAACLEEWRKMYQRKSGAHLQAAIDLAESGRKTPARTYAQIQQIIGDQRNSS